MSFITLATFCSHKLNCRPEEDCGAQLKAPDSIGGVDCDPERVWHHTTISIERMASIVSPLRADVVS